MTKHISQREARRLQKRVAQLESDQEIRLPHWRDAYPGGVNIETLMLGEISAAKLDVATRLGFVIVAKIHGTSLRLHAVKP